SRERHCIREIKQRLARRFCATLGREMNRMLQYRPALINAGVNETCLLVVLGFSKEALRNLFTILTAIILAVCICGFGQEQNANEGLNALVQVLGQTDDPQFQLDILKGMSEGLKGRKGVPMPAGWDAVATKLSQSPKP